MAELLKEIYHETFLTDFGKLVQTVEPQFKTQDFINTVLAAPWETLALKQRTRKIAQVLGQYLPHDYPTALAKLVQIAPQCQGFAYLFMPDFVVVYGDLQVDWSRSMRALACFTQQSSAEFAIRSFILADPKRTMQQLNQWAQSDNEHLRRLASEGCRPRLPWGQSLPIFKADPAPVLKLLDQLKADPSLYVRRSVANNLNDIAKDHPDQVIVIAHKWQGQSAETDWIIRHGCRTLLRKSFNQVKDIFGYAIDQPNQPVVQKASIQVSEPIIAIGEALVLNYRVQLRSEIGLFIRIEYAIDYVKASGKVSRKLFKLLDKPVNGFSPVVGKRKISFKDLTTRKHYPGQHKISLIVNGQTVAETVLKVTD